MELRDVPDRQGVPNIARWELFPFELLEIGSRIFVEFRFALLAAQFDFLALVGEGERLAHLAELLIGDDSGIELVRPHRLLLLLGLHFRDGWFGLLGEDAGNIGQGKCGYDGGGKDAFCFHG